MFNLDTRLIGILDSLDSVRDSLAQDTKLKEEGMAGSLVGVAARAEQFEEVVGCVHELTQLVRELNNKIRD